MMKFCVLGTKAGGAPLARKHGSATALVLGSATALFDCAESTQTQLLRAHVSRAHIHHIFISHLHGDHILGLPALLNTMGADKRSARLHLYAPEGLEEYIRLGLKIMDVQLSFDIEFHVLRQDYSENLAEINGFRVSARRLEHRIESYGFRVDEPQRRNIDIEKARALGVESGAVLGAIKREGAAQLESGRVVQYEDIAAAPRPTRSFAYCGDTRPCAASVALAHNASVLLHEATFRADMNDKALERYHSTSEQAARIAAEAGVEKLFLTHLSVRYKSGAPLLREARKIFPATFLAKELVIEEII
jgi:ribonuclease Z